MMSVDELHRLSGAYALDAVDDTERLAFEQHLVGCASCREEVARLQDAAGELGALMLADPPASLKASIMREIAFVQPLPAPPVALPVSEPASDVGAEPVAEPAGPWAGTSPGVASLDEHRRRRMPVRSWFAGAAAAAVLAVGALVWQPWADDTSRLSQTEQVLQASDAQRYSQQVGAATATVVRSASLGRAVFVAQDMPPVPADKVYELWLRQSDGSFTKAGLMPRDSGRVTVALDGDAAVAVGAGITVEPAGGSNSPTSPPLALLNWA